MAFCLFFVLDPKPQISAISISKSTFVWSVCSIYSITIIYISRDPEIIHFQYESLQCIACLFKLFHCALLYRSFCCIKTLISTQKDIYFVKHLRKELQRKLRLIYTNRTFVEFTFGFIFWLAKKNFLFTVPGPKPLPIIFFLLAILSLWVFNLNLKVIFCWWNVVVAVAAGLWISTRECDCD